MKYTWFVKPPVLPAAAALLTAVCLLVSLAYASTEAESVSGGDGYISVRMGASLWETLIENGVNPTLWKDVFQYNRETNPAFSRIRKANAIPRGTTIYIPIDRDVKPAPPERELGPAASRSVSKNRPAIRDTVSFLNGIAFAEINAGGRRHINEIVAHFCVPAGISDPRQKSLIARNAVSDLKDLYRRMGRELAYRDQTFFIPLYLLAEHQVATRQNLNLVLNEHAAYLPRDSIFPVNPDDIVHMAKEGEDYEVLAKLYAGSIKSFPQRYPYRSSPREHLGYMAQIIRHYNLNQPLWPGEKYLIPEWLQDGRYYDQAPQVELDRRSASRLYYSNGLEVSLEYRVTRKKSYWKSREQYYIPFQRRLPDGKPAYPDMILWHRTGLEPEVEEILRTRGKKHFSLRYIHRTAVANYYIDESGECFQVVDPEKNARDHAGAPFDFRCLWEGQTNISDVSIGVEVEGWFLGGLSPQQLATARKLQEMLRSRWIIPVERVLDHRKVACRRGPDRKLLRGRKADGLNASDRMALGIVKVLDADVLRRLVDPNLDEIQGRQSDNLDYWYNVELDPDLVETAELIGWRLDAGSWRRPAPEQAGEVFPYFQLTYGRPENSVAPRIADNVPPHLTKLSQTSNLSGIARVKTVREVCPGRCIIPLKDQSFSFIVAQPSRRYVW